MSKRKYYLTVRYETKEDFDKNFKDIYQSGYKHGYEDGCKDALARLIYAFEHEFDAEDISDAQALQRRLEISRCRKRQALEDGIKKLGVKEYLEMKV